ncbi:SH3 domain-containing protein [Mesobacillus jeotgali]|uniref:SH3 domain-containing protein n=1 Tax=Mesobacillus jeotgali TaxID=129985 RepID=A0ABY9VGF6_9BACI|nr:SH3 domain-containing protein [Mesobacillus jeotgali]WNF22673.1 SH3 domain-containing protein [Mesobacillus jeotgali]
MNKFGKVLILSTSILIGGNSAPIEAINAEAAVVNRINKTTYQTISNLNMRAGAGTHFKVLLTIPKGQRVMATERSGNWFKVSYSYSDKGKKVTKTGWVTGSYLKVVTSGSNSGTLQAQAVGITKMAKTTYKTTSNLNIRTGDGLKYKVVKTVPKGGIVTSSERKGSWYKVVYSYSYKGKKVTVSGWAASSYLKEYYQYQTIKGTYLNTMRTTGLYPSPDTKKKPLFTSGSSNGFYTNQKVINSTGQTWYRVSYKGKAVYLPAGNIAVISASSFAKTDFLTNKETYLLSGMGNVYTKLLKIPKNIKLSSNVKVGNWYKVSYGGKTGFILAADLSKYTPPKPAPAPAPAPAELPEAAEPSQPASPVDSPETMEPGQSAPEQDPQTDLVETTISGKTYVTTSALNFRKSAGTDSEILAVVPNSTFVFPTHKVSNGWYKVSYNEKSGYLSGDFIKEVITGDPMHRDGYQFIDLRKPSKVTAVHIDQYISNNLKGRSSVLAGKGQAFINAGNKYGVNALYLAAHAIHESGFGTSNISLGKYNLFGFGAFDATPFIGAVRFESVEQNIDYIAQEMKATYLNLQNWKYKGAYLGFTTRSVAGNARIDSNSTGMNFYYASDVKWGQKIASHMQNILPYNKVDYDQAAVNSVMFSFPSRPAGMDAFPAGTLAIAKKDMKLTSQKGSTTLAVTLKKDTVFEIIEKHNDYWVKVKADNKDYWTNDIKFDRYREFISVKNLGRVNVSSLNVRPTASTALAPIGSFKLNEYVHLLPDASGNPVMNSTNTWYNVRLADGKTGWVSASYIIQELK